VEEYLFLRNIKFWRKKGNIIKSCNGSFISHYFPQDYKVDMGRKCNKNGRSKNCLKILLTNPQK
jgi:hypothetical protein